MLSGNLPTSLAWHLLFFYSIIMRTGSPAGAGSPAAAAKPLPQHRWQQWQRGKQIHQRGRGWCSRRRHSQAGQRGEEEFVFHLQIPQQLHLVAPPSGFLCWWCCEFKQRAGRWRCRSWWLGVCGEGVGCVGVSDVGARGEAFSPVESVRTTHCRSSLSAAAAALPHCR